MGQSPGTCTNRYDSAITQMIINNGTQIFDPVNNPGVTFRAEAHSGYSLSMTLHTADQSSNGNQDIGTTWYNENTLGFQNGHCVDNVGPNEDKTLNLSHTWNYAGLGPPKTQNVFWHTIGGNDVSYTVEWYDQETGPPPPSTTSQLTVNSQDSSGNTISGYFVELSQNGNQIATGFTPATFDLNNGEQYTVQVQDYGDFVFDHWFDTGSTDRNRQISTSSNTEITAVYRDITAPPPPGQSKISVKTVNSVGDEITGYYTTLWQGGTMLQSCWSPCAFFVNNGATYQVAVADYGEETFVMWSDGTLDRFHTVETGSSSTTISLTAIYSP